MTLVARRPLLTDVSTPIVEGDRTDAVDDAQYVLSVPGPRKTYNYFRPGGAVKRQEFPAVRLSDDLEEATRQARALARISADPGQAALYRMVGPLLKKARRHARDLGASFALSGDEVFAMLEDQAGRCAVSGLPFEPFRQDGPPHPLTPVIELRGDESGYAPQTVWIVCSLAGSVIRGWGLDAFHTVAAGVMRMSKSKRT